MDRPGTADAIATTPIVVAFDDREREAAEPSDEPPSEPPADEPPVDLGRWTALARDVVSGEAIGAMQVNVVFVSADAIAELKREHLDGDGAPTDVLAFPMDEPTAAPVDAGGPPLVLGDVIICPAVAAAQAADHAGSYDDEVALLLVHGLLHLLGMDHAEADERATMQERERELLARHHGPLAGDPWRTAS